MGGSFLPSGEFLPELTYYSQEIFRLSAQSFSTECPSKAAEDVKFNGVTGFTVEETLFLLAHPRSSNNNLCYVIFRMKTSSSYVVLFQTDYFTRFFL